MKYTPEQSLKRLAELFPDKFCYFEEPPFSSELDTIHIKDGNGKYSKFAYPSKLTQDDIDDILAEVGLEIETKRTFSMSFDGKTFNKKYISYIAELDGTSFIFSGDYADTKKQASLSALCKAVEIIEEEMGKNE